MPSINDLLRSLGNDGAITNVRAVLDSKQREDWLVKGLALRLEDRDRPELVAGSVPDTVAGAA